MTDATAETLRRDLEAAFPPVQFAMAYGSGVFTQKDHDNSTSMIDLVFAVDDAERWHADNLARNPSHYSFLQYLGPNGITRVQEDYGAGVYYNTLVPLPSSGAHTQRLIKYGVVSTETLCRDLTDWTTLYLSGRMHKPVHILSSNAQLEAASALNLDHALHYALLCLPDKFTHTDLFMKIAGISYLGDFRMTFGENPKKVRNIVEGNMEAFREVYRRKLERSPFVSPSIHDREVLVANTLDKAAHRQLVESLPATIAQKLEGPTEVTAKRIQRAVASVVHRYSRSQSIKGIFTAGAAKTIVYVAQKLQRTYWRKR